MGLFADLLRQARLACGLTQEELAGRTGLSVRAISDLERGRTVRPHPRSVRLLAGALGLSPEAGDRLARAAHVAAYGADERRKVDASGGEARQTTGLASPAHAVAQLPADVADFVGRKDLVGELCRLLGAAAGARSPGAVRVAVVAGQGGIGKTSVAVHVAHRVASRFPDGHLYVNLQGSSAQSLTPGEVLGRFLRGLGVDGSAVPPGEPERAAAYRSALADRRVLIVLDDARDAAQVRPLLPGRASCAVLVTSRNSLADLDGAVTAELDILPPAEARALFARVVGERRAAAAPGGVRAVLDACAGLPLAIRIAAARLASRPAWHVEDLAGRLADERRRLDELAVGNRAVRASFQVSYDALTPREPGGADAARAFRLLGLWPGKDLSLAAAAAMLGYSCERAERELDVLLDAHLLGSPAHGRYRFHDLLRVFAAERAQEQESGQARADAMGGLLGWYLHTMAAAARVLTPVRPVPAFERSAAAGELPAFDSYSQALSWCDSELANLVTATAEAARHGLHDIAWKLPVTAWGFFDLRKHWAEWITTHHVALGSARRLDDRYGQAWVLNNLAIAHGQQLQSAQAIEYLEKSLALRREIEDRQGEAWTLNNIGGVLFYQGHYQTSIEYFKQALAIRREIADKRGEAATLTNLGEVYGRIKVLDKAMECLQEALTVTHALGDLYGERGIMQGLALSFTYLGEFEKAVKCCEKSLEIARQIGDRYGIARSLDLMGHTLSRAGHPDQARESWEQACALYTTLGHPDAARVQTFLDQLSGKRSTALSPP